MSFLRSSADWIRGRLFWGARGIRSDLWSNPRETLNAKNGSAHTAWSSSGQRRWLTGWEETAHRGSEVSLQALDVLALVCTLSNTSGISLNKDFYSSSGFNLLLYGVGSKRNLLEDFRLTLLKDLTHVVVNGYFPSLTIKSVSCYLFHSCFLSFSV